MANLETQIEPNKKKILRVIESELIGLQITFERENEYDDPVPTGLVMYNYITQCFMVMTQKMGGPFFRDIIEAERQKILTEDRIQISDHYNLHVAREITGNY